MTDQPTTAPPAAAPAFDPERRAKELAILDALRNVVDPEIGMNVVELALIKQVLLGETESEVKMILTTPFCPYAGSMIAQVKEQAEIALDHPELRRLGVAAAYCYAADHRERYAEFFAVDGTLLGPAYTAEEAAELPEHLRRPGVVVAG